MAEYFFLLDEGLFEKTIRPALAASWKARSFAPCRAYCETILLSAREFTDRYHTGGESLIESALGGLVFDRHTWRALVGETLLCAAVEIPEFQACGDTLCCLLAPQHYREQVVERARLAPIQQAHFGARDLTFGLALYRPQFAGWNNAEDVRRLAAYLDNIHPEAWTVSDLAGLRDVEVTDFADELDFAREWFPALAEMYRRAESHGFVIVHETIY
jgi:hypothetical protein